MTTTYKNNKAALGCGRLDNFTPDKRKAIMDNNIVKSPDKQEAKEEKISLKNAFKIKFKKGTKLTSSIKKNLNTKGCQFSSLFSAYVCPIEIKGDIELLFEKNKVKADLDEIYNPIPKKTRKINGMESRLYILETEAHEEDMRLVVEANQMKNKDGEARSIYEFEEPPKEPDEDKENDDIRYRLEMDIHNRVKALKEKKEEIENLRNSLQLHESEKSENEKILERLQKNESGDAEIFIELHNDKYIFDPTEGKNGAYYLWDDSYWKLDIHKERYKDFEKVPGSYLIASADENMEENIKKELFKRSQQLRTSRRRFNVLETVSAYLSFKEKWDQSLKMLPCKNCIVDLITGDFFDHRQNLYIRKISPVNYNPDAKCPKFDSFLNDIALGDQEWIEFLQRLIGYACLGIPKEEIIVYFYGKDGRNGKGTLTKLLAHVLGSLLHTFPSEIILMQRSPPSSGTPRPELANFQGVRLAIFSEINKNRQIDSAQIKNLSGRDTIPCRNLYSKVDLQIEPTHTMFIQTNYKPKASSEDKALWHRNILVPFKASFVRDPKEEYEKPLKEDLKEELLEEAEGILNWIIEGCQKYQKHGLNIPQSIRDETENYRKENDGIGLFIKERCILGNGFTAPKGKMEKSIKEYCEANGLEKPTRNEISAYLKKRFSDGSTGANRYWDGVKIED